MTGLPRPLIQPQSSSNTEAGRYRDLVRRRISEGKYGRRPEDLVRWKETPLDDRED